MDNIETGFSGMYGIKNKTKIQNTKKLNSLQLNKRSNKKTEIKVVKMTVERDKYILN